MVHVPMLKFQFQKLKTEKMTKITNDITSKLR